MADRFLRFPQVKARVGFSHSWVYEKIAQGLFPKPLKVGRSSVWLESEITKWLAERVQEARDPGASCPPINGGTAVVSMGGES
jgi:prophage regulatory protein